MTSDYVEPESLKLEGRPRELPTVPGNSNASNFFGCSFQETTGRDRFHKEMLNATDQNDLTDPAAIFGCALSLWQECHKRTAHDGSQNLSEIFNGIDGFMRVIMSVANRFEQWSSRHVAFEDLDNIWPYLLKDEFGRSYVTLMGVESLEEFDDQTCLRVALHLKIPLRYSEGLRIPVDVTVANPISNSLFRKFRIQTVREDSENDSFEPFTLNDDPFDARFSYPQFALYGITADGLLEHIADRKTYADALSLAGKIAPGVQFPVVTEIGKKW